MGHALSQVDWQVHRIPLRIEREVSAVAGSGFAGSPQARRLALGACLALALGSSFAGRLASAAEATAVCSYPAGVTAGVWAPLPSSLSSIAQLDSDPCQLVGVSPPGVGGGAQVWRSSDAGVHWAVQPGAPALDSIVTERLTKRAGSRLVGPLLATGPTTVGGGPTISVDAVDQVYASQDGGRRFSPSLETVAAGTVPLHGRLLGAATAITYIGGSPRPDVYVATAPAMSPPGPGVSAEPLGYRLLKSTDGGATFAALPTGAGIAATVVDVSPSNPDEIWVNNAHTDSAGGGAFLSRDAGSTWTPACCPTATVHDITVMAAADATVVYLATDQGLMVSEDDGATWSTLTSAATEQVRTAPDDAYLVLGVSDGRVLLWRGLGARPTQVPGLPAGCTPTQLRRDAVVPVTFLVNCGSGSTYRLLLDNYGHEGKPPTAPGQPGGLPASPNNPLTSAVPLKELATWRLPGANLGSGAIAFDGRALYYDTYTGGIALVKAADGAYAGHFLPDGQPSLAKGLTVDLKRNQLLVTQTSGDLSAYDLASHRHTRLSAVPYDVVTFDASFDGLSWVREGGDSIEQASRLGGPTSARTLCIGASNGSHVSTFVADGSGGGYVQPEDDASIFRINRACARVGPVYRHRVFSESGLENDAMACDAQTFFPQVAIWIRDSEPGTVSAYGVPYGYCPMPSKVTIPARTVSSGASTSICAVLSTASTAIAIADRPVSVSVGGVFLGNRVSDAVGRVCLPYVAPAVGPSGARLELRADFAGDRAFYGSVGLSTLTVTNVGPPLVRFPVAIVAGPLGYPPPPPNPVTNVAGQPAPAPGPVSNLAQAPQAQAQAQAQSGLQAAVVPQPQRQVQLALVTAAQQLDARGAGENAMSALSSPGRHQPRWPAPLLVLVGAISCGFGGALGRSRTQVSVLRVRFDPHKVGGRSPR
jgi:hypothetical protein